MEKRRKKELRALILRRIDPRKNRGIMSWTLIPLGWVVYFVALVFKPIIFFYLLMPFVIVFFIHHKRQAGIYNRVIRCDHYLCVWCRYPLCDLPDVGVCPECGSGYRKELCQMLYRYAYAGLSPGTKVLQQREKWLWARALRERDRVQP